MAKRRPRETPPQPLTSRAHRSASQERSIVVLFADIVGASEVSNHKSLSDYSTFLEEFRRIFQTVADDHKTSWYEEHERPYFDASIRGDEGCLMVFVPGRDDLSDDVDTAINIALDLKRRWLLSSDNRNRIEDSGLLPSELAIGIHVGKVYINTRTGSDGTPKYRPEGYTINLTKRIESASRDGQFTRIYVSEAARGELYLLTDEATYSFGPVHSIQPKNISRDIRVYEVKHHFLATDWSYSGAVSATNRTKAAEFKPTDEEVELFGRAYQASPTNLWLAEELIMLRMQRAHERLVQADETEDKKALKDAYHNAETVCKRLTAGDLRDAGVFTLAGFICGEYTDYEEEQRLYRVALQLDDQYPEAYWYLGYSLSCRLHDKLMAEKRAKVERSELNEEEWKIAQDSIANYERAIGLNPRQAWMRYDLACELARWDQEDTAINALERAADLNAKVRLEIPDEEYLERIRSHPRIKKLLDGKEEH